MPPGGEVHQLVQGAAEGPLFGAAATFDEGGGGCRVEPGSVEAVAEGGEGVEAHVDGEGSASGEPSEVEV